MNNLSKIFLIIIIILSITVCIMAGIFIKVREINNNNVERLLNIFEENHELNIRIKNLEEKLKENNIEFE